MTIAVAGGGGGGGGRLPHQSFTMFAAICSPSSLSVLILFPLHYEHHIFNEGGWGGGSFPPVETSPQFAYLSITRRLLGLQARGYHMAKSVLNST